MTPRHMIRRFPPWIMRHTAASWLVQDSVPLYDVQALLGHKDYATTQRYAHLARAPTARCLSPALSVIRAGPLRRMRRG
jgi:site-specific recombinase XerD